jgi:hypothetical protein
MVRTRLAGVVVAFGLNLLLSGCCVCFDPRGRFSGCDCCPECCCDMAAPCCEGPVLGPPTGLPPVPPPPIGPAPASVPPLAPAPRIVPQPLAQPTPYIPGNGNGNGVR